MQTNLIQNLRDTASGRTAESILRKCVHCGFCNAACPTYHLRGDELDGPRGRIYQVKQLLEGDGGAAMRVHLDRCLICRACEAACPSGVEYGTLLEIGKAELDVQFPRKRIDNRRRKLFAAIIHRRRVFAALWRLGRFIKPILPHGIAAQIPRKQKPLPRTLRKWPPINHPRRMLVLTGCVQSQLAPNTNLAAAIVLDRLGISLFEVGAQCCGGVALHTSTASDGAAVARKLIDQWMPHIAQVEAVVITASGCGVTIKDYSKLFADNPEYREKAQAIAAKARDLSEIVARELPDNYRPTALALDNDDRRRKVVYHPPCTLQHAQKLSGGVEAILTRAGYEICPLRDAHRCCGSAGTYSIFEPHLADALRREKCDAIAESIDQSGADEVCTANIGCQMHINNGYGNGHDKIAVKHWIELLL